MIDEKELVFKIICANCGYPQEHDVPVILFHERALKDKENGEITRNSLTCDRCGKWLIEFTLVPIVMGDEK